jgi:hypothetical protein
MAQNPCCCRTVRMPRLRPWRRAFILLCTLLLVGLTTGEACAETITGFLIYRVRVHDGQKWHTQDMGPEACASCGKSEWKFLTGTDWPDKVKVEVFWRRIPSKITYSNEDPWKCQAFKDGSPASSYPNLPQLAKIDGFKGLLFTYENVSKNSSFKVAVKYTLWQDNIVSPNETITLKTVADFKFPWVTILAPAEGQTFQAGPIPLLVEVKSNIPKKPSTVRLEVVKKVGRKWAWAPPGAIDIPWASFPYTMPTPAIAGEYRMRAQGKKGSTIGVFSPWRTYKVQ